MEIADAIVAAVSAFDLKFQLAEGLIDFIVHDQKIFELEIIKLHQRLYRFARKVHKGLRLNEQDLLIADLDLLRFGFEFGFEIALAFEDFNQRIDKKKSDIVTGNL